MSKEYEENNYVNDHDEDTEDECGCCQPSVVDCSDCPTPEECIW